MGREKEDMTGAKTSQKRIPRKSGKGGKPPAQVKLGSGDPIDNIFRNHGDEIEKSEDENADYAFPMDGGPTANPDNAAGTTTGIDNAAGAM